MIEQFASKMGRPKINESGFAIVPLSFDYRAAIVTLALPLSQTSQEASVAAHFDNRLFWYTWKILFTKSLLVALITGMAVYQ